MVELGPGPTHQVVTSGFGTYSAGSLDLPLSNYTTTAWITDGSASVSCDPAGSPLTVNLAKFHLPVTAAWYDLSYGTCAEVTGSPFANSGLKVFTTPGLNHDNDTNWVLLLQAHPAFTSKPAPRY